MLRLSVLHAHPGMVLAMPVTHPTRKGAVLLRAGAELDEHCIPRLAELGVREVWIRYPGLEDLVRFVDPRIIESYEALTSSAGALLDSALVQSRVEIDYYSYRRAVLSVLEEITRNPKAGLFVSQLAGADQPYARHAGNVGVLSLLMGLKLDFYLVRERGRFSSGAAKDLAALGVGAMVHDIGLARLDNDVLARWNERHDESDAGWQQHVRIGYEMVKDSLDAVAAGIVLHHHQHHDGTGFPRRVGLEGVEIPLAGSDVHVFARIVGCADLYDRLRYPAHTPGSKDASLQAIPGVTAIRRMLGEPYRGWIDPVVMLGLLTVAPPFTPGSWVTLSDGRDAVVVKHHPLDPCSPEVEVIDTLVPARSLRPSRRERIDLRQPGAPTIRSIDGQDVSEDLFHPTRPGEFDLAGVARRSMGRVDQMKRPAA